VIVCRIKLPSLITVSSRSQTIPGPGRMNAGNSPKWANRYQPIMAVARDSKIKNQLRKCLFIKKTRTGRGKVHKQCLELVGRIKYICASTHVSKPFSYPDCTVGSRITLDHAQISARGLLPPVGNFTLPRRCYSIVFFIFRLYISVFCGSIGSSLSKPRSEQGYRFLPGYVKPKYPYHPSRLSIKAGNTHKCVNVQ
jgi:hypothetical protein